MYRQVVYASACEFQYGNYMPNSYNGLSDVVVEVRRGTGVIITNPSYVFIYQNGCANYLISKYVENTINSVVKFPSTVFEIGYSYYAVWRCENGPIIAKSNDIVASSPVPNPPTRLQPNPMHVNQRQQAQIEAGNSIYYWGLKEEEKDVFRNYFDDIDRNGDGNVTHSELQLYYSRLIGINLTANEISDMIKEADIYQSNANRNGTIQLWEFIDITMKALLGNTSLKWQKLADLLKDDLSRAKRRRVY